MKWIWGLWNAQAHKGGVGGRGGNRTMEITYRAMDLVRLFSSYYPVSLQSDSEGRELFFSLLGGFKMCQGYQRRHVVSTITVTDKLKELNVAMIWVGTKDGKRKPPGEIIFAFKMFCICQNPEQVRGFYIKTTQGCHIIVFRFIW